MLSILDSIEGGYSIFIDGKWGDGKTFFVKQLSILLECKNPNLSCGVTEAAGLLAREHSFADVGFRNSYLPVYYNAWENDSDVDPVVSLLGTLVSEYEIPDFEVKEVDIGKRIATVLDVVLKPINLDIARGVMDGFESKDLIKPYREDRTIREKLVELLNLVIAEQAEKIVLFIDELDRCSPTFAVRLLERTKYLFTQENIIVVFSTNVTQLTRSIEGFYGSGFDSSSYLSRFYDMKTALSPVYPKRYLMWRGIPETSAHLNMIAHEMVDKLGYSMRDINRYYASIKVLDQRAPASGSSALLSFFDVGLLLTIFALGIVNQDLYQSILAGTGFNELREFVSDCDEFNRFQEKCRASCASKISGDEFLRAVYLAAFTQDNCLGGISDFNDASDLKAHAKLYLTVQGQL
jgi:hypothetical protein